MVIISAMLAKLPSKSRESSPPKPPKLAPLAGHGDAPAISSVAWQPTAELNAQEWVALGHRLGMISRASQWWIGDWIHYGTSRWGEKYALAARITGYDVASLRNMAWVAARFDPSLRSDKLTWSHHALLAPLNREEKEYWLNLAVENCLSVSDLRLELRASKKSSHAGKRLKPPELICPECGHRLRPGDSVQRV